MTEISLGSSQNPLFLNAQIQIYMLIVVGVVGAFLVWKYFKTKRLSRWGVFGTLAFLLLLSLFQIALYIGSVSNVKLVFDADQQTLSIEKSRRLARPLIYRYTLKSIQDFDYTQRMTRCGRRGRMCQKRLIYIIQVRFKSGNLIPVEEAAAGPHHVPILKQALKAALER